MTLGVYILIYMLVEASEDSFVSNCHSDKDVQKMIDAHLWTKFVCEYDSNTRYYLYVVTM